MSTSWDEPSAVFAPPKSNDLWHWNGDLRSPVWTEHQRHQSASMWPPMWVAPLGWASDADGGELWLVGDSGEVKELDRAASQQSLIGSNVMWRFSLRTGDWYCYQADKVDAAGSWPAPRESASLAGGGWMFGGNSAIRSDHGSRECVGNTSLHAKQSPARSSALLSGLWRWQDNAGSVFYQ